MAESLEGKTIVVGLSGGIACYKAAELVRLLSRRGARVRVVMTRNAAEFIAPLTLQTLSGAPVATETFSLTRESEIGHVRLADAADALVVAPATANVIGKMAAGIADDLLTTVVVATQAPVLIAPAMNVHMFENPVVQRNLDTLRQLGHRVIEPAAGFLACGYEGPGRLPEPAALVAEVERAVGPADLAGARVLVTAGPTREAIDPVRFISNRSTGKMGYAVAAAAWRRGAEVVLISGPTGLSQPHGVSRTSVTTAAEMRDAVKKAGRRADVVLMVAAVADYRPTRSMARKLKKDASKRVVELTRTVDILAELGGAKKGRIVVGFAAETDRVSANAERKLREKGIDLIVANDVSRPDAGFAVDTNRVVLIDADGHRPIPPASKVEVAERILDRVVELRTSGRGRRPHSRLTRRHRSS